MHLPNRCEHVISEKALHYIKFNQMKRLIYLSCMLFLYGLLGRAQETAEKNTILIINATVFDGQNEKMQEGMSILVEGNKIAKIAKTINIPQTAQVVNAQGKVLMPGLIDAHAHPMFAGISQQAGLTSQDGYLNLVAAKTAEKFLMQGFTSLREASGNSISLKCAIDQGLYLGPRIYPTGPMISQTSGHADYRPSTSIPYDPNATLSYIERSGHALIADGVPEIIKGVRSVLRMGATQVKLGAGGGVASIYDPLDVTQYTFEELKAAVDVAETWNTYVMVHAYTPKAIQTSLGPG